MTTAKQIHPECAECGFRSSDHRTPDLPEMIAALAGDLADVLVRADADDGALLRARPKPGVWSPLEYGCHVRDVLMVQRDRIVHTLIAERPEFTTMYRNQRPHAARYADEPSSLVVNTLRSVADLMAHSLTGLTAQQWRRPCVLNRAERVETDVRGLAQHTLHEVLHHRLDVRRVLLPATP